MGHCNRINNCYHFTECILIQFLGYGHDTTEEVEDTEINSSTVPSN